MTDQPKPVAAEAVQSYTKLTELLQPDNFNDALVFYLAGWMDGQANKPLPTLNDPITEVSDE